MTDSHSDPAAASASSQENVRAIFTWLDAPPPANAADSLPLLHMHLASLRSSQSTPEQHAIALERLYTRGISAVTTLVPALTDVLLPLPRKTRQLVRSIQDLLQVLAEDLLATLNMNNEQMIRGTRQTPDLTLWRSLDALAQHLLISDLAASPAGIGIWRQLHQTYDTALRLRIADNQPGGVPCRLQDVYFSAVLLGCAQPASFTSNEVDFVAAYLKSFVRLVDLNIEATAKFWIDPTRDSPPIACARKQPPPETPAYHFSCDRIAALLKQQLTALDAGNTPEQLKLPDFSATPAGQGVLRRLITYWGEPGKRRFPRRRQNYRAALCAGLDSLWHLFQEGEAAAIETSSWMITNESPDGYATMHVSGKTGSLSVGDVVALRTESGENWQIGIIRWALSENQEHLELGLQILATRAVPALLALPAASGGRKRLSVLILPKIKSLRPTEMLVVPSGALDEQSSNLILIIEKENLEIREVRSTQLDEQNSHIEVFSIEPDPSAT